MGMLDQINGPEDIKALRIDQLQQLADETREALIYRQSHMGGHVGSNLGIVELTVAMHYVFHSPTDKIVFDVSHQCYAHKLLTGRKTAYLQPELFSEVTGYTNPLESEHDLFTVGHASTSVSLSLGLAKGRDICGGTENIIAVIGDGALSGGEALEALSYAGEYSGNLIIVVNDNEQSIAENHGGIYQCLAELRETNGESERNIFRDFDLDYLYLEEGHDIKRLVEVFDKIKNADHPVVVHIHTVKGKGLSYAEEEKEKWHEAFGPFCAGDGLPIQKEAKGKDFTVFKSLKRFLDTNKNGIVFNAATPLALGFVSEYRNLYAPRGQFVDVGIAEENAVTMAAGAAKNGAKAVVALLAPFFQRVYDQISHDVALNDLPVTMLVINPGVYGMSSNTHLALCDIQMFAHIPNIVYLAPTCREEFKQMFQYAVSQNKHPTMIRTMPIFPVSRVKDETDYSVLKSKVERQGRRVAIFAVGPLLPMAMKTAEEVERRTGESITVINPRFLNGIDEALCDWLLQDHTSVVTLEDGELIGGYGQTIASYYGDKPMKVINHGISKKFHTNFVAAELLEEHGMSVEKLVVEVEKILNAHF